MKTKADLLNEAQVFDGKINMDYSISDWSNNYKSKQLKAMAKDYDKLLKAVNLYLEKGCQAVLSETEFSVKGVLNFASTIGINVYEEENKKDLKSKVSKL